MPQVEDRCSCEQVARGPYGVIGDNERLARVICEHHIGKNGSIKLSILPLSHIGMRGLSVTRMDRITRDQLRIVADRVAQSSPGGSRTAVGVLTCSTLDARSLIDGIGLRSCCVFDDPVKDNPAHAAIVRSIYEPDHQIDVTSPELLELRDRLMQIFSKEVEQI